MTEATEQFRVFNRWTSAVQFTAEITCTPDAALALKLGLAVLWGHKNRASLDGAILDGAILDGAILVGAILVGARLVGARLVGANLDGARLDGARLDGANLDGANLVGANLFGANLDGKEIKALLARVTRNDGYEFFLWLFKDTSHIIKAGCRTYTIEEFRAHVSRSYPGTPKARETLAILDYCERRLADETGAA